MHYLNKRRKTLYVITRDGVGGAQNHLSSLIRGLALNQVSVLCIGSDGNLAHGANSLGCNVYLFEKLDGLFSIFELKKLRDVIRLERPHIVHVHSSIAAFITRLATIGLDCKLVYTVHGWHFTNPDLSSASAFLLRLLERSFKLVTDYWIVLSKFDLQQGIKYKTLRSENSWIVPNGVSDMPARKPTVNNELFNIAFVGRASKQKNPLAAINVMKSLDSHFHLTMFISGNNVAKIKGLIHSLGLDSKITIQADLPDAGDSLNGFDVLLVTSIYEGMPLAILEALRFGVPIIATNVCGLSEVVKDGVNGYLINIDNNLEVNIAKKMKFLCDNSRESTNLGCHARITFENQYVESKMITKTESIYNHIIKDLY